MKINRPPLGPGFWLPTREDLLDIKVGTIVKLIFENDQGFAERMWVNVTSTEHTDEWVAELNNQPLDMEGMEVGDEVRFHPYDIINIWEG